MTLLQKFKLFDSAMKDFPEFISSEKPDIDGAYTFIETHSGLGSFVHIKSMWDEFYWTYQELTQN